MAPVNLPYDDALKEMLQSAVQSIQWTYIIFWQFCPQQRVLVWRDGYYNGEIKTMKTVQSVEICTQKATLNRSEQLRELYDSLSNEDKLVSENQQMMVTRPSLALSPEDLTETEWFYILCVSFTYALGEGLVGKAYGKQQYVWLTGANQVDSKVFTRAILAKSAHIETVICIPLLNGVVELGTTEKVEEKLEIIEHVKLLFLVDSDNPFLPPPKPAHSAHSAHSSNTTLSPHQISPIITIKRIDNTYLMEEDIENDNHDDEETEYNEGEDDEEEDENGLDYVAENLSFSRILSEDNTFGTTNDDSSHLDSHFKLLTTSHGDSCRPELTHGCSDTLELNNQTTILLQTSEKLTQEENHYSTTVSTILKSQLTQQPNSNATSLLNSLFSIESSFTTWTPNHPPSQHLTNKTTSNFQKLLKNIIFKVPFLHNNNKSIDPNNTSESFTLTSHTPSNEDLSVNHALTERRRREKLNERFDILRSLVPLVTKMDKASILGDTIEYVKQLRKKIHDLEEHCQTHLDRLKVADKRKIRVMEMGGGGAGRRVGTAVHVEVSIIESDALVEIQCKHKDGLLLDVMIKLRELGVEITSVQSCVDSGMCTAEMRAKVKVNGGSGKRTSITQVKKAVNQIIFQ